MSDYKPLSDEVLDHHALKALHGTRFSFDVMNYLEQCKRANHLLATVQAYLDYHDEVDLGGSCEESWTLLGNVRIAAKAYRGEPDGD